MISVRPRDSQSVLFITFEVTAIKVRSRQRNIPITVQVNQPIPDLKLSSREARGIGWIETLLQDVRYSIRGFRRTPGFSVTVVATIALGLGLNTTLFTVFNAYVLRPLAVRDPYSLYQFTWMNRSGENDRFSWHEFQDFQNQNPAFSEVLGFDHLGDDLSVPALARRAGMSPRNFARAFRREIGTTPAAYVEAQRVEGARRLLETAEASVAEVAAACGFARVETMHRAFRRGVRVTPGQYRRHFRAVS